VPKSTTPAPTDILPDSFEAGLSELNTLVARMEAGDAPLADMLAHYQRGTTLLKFCESQLKDAEQQLQVLEGDTLKPLTL
jgi:exodeoxyribonuclease VII small subunit